MHYYYQIECYYRITEGRTSVFMLNNNCFFTRVMHSTAYFVLNRFAPSDFYMKMRAVTSRKESRHFSL